MNKKAIAALLLAAEQALPILEKLTELNGSDLVDMGDDLNGLDFAHDLRAAIKGAKAKQ